MTLPANAPQGINDFPSFDGIDYIEFFVGNARQTAHFLRTAFGFAPIAHAGLETGLQQAGARDP